jgi:F-type H+-transporting ATPase subunit delta
VARPYATALFQVTEKEGVPALREIEGQLANVAELFRIEPQVVRLFEVPSVSPATKLELVNTIAKTLSLRREAQRMLVALEHHMRLRYLNEVVTFFGELVDRKEGVVRGRVELPVPASQEQVVALGKGLAELLGTRVELDFKLREELLAGFVVRVGSRVFDGSLVAQVRRFASSVAGE